MIGQSFNIGIHYIRFLVFTIITGIIKINISNIINPGVILINLLFIFWDFNKQPIISISKDIIKIIVNKVIVAI